MTEQRLSPEAMAYAIKNAPELDETEPPGPDEPELASGELWPGSPVRALGVDDGTCYFIDGHGQTRRISRFQRHEILALFHADETLLKERYPKKKQDESTGEWKVIGWDSAKAMTEMMQVCHRLGIWSADNRVRGPGMWRDEDDKLVVHCGDKMLIDNAWTKPGIHQSKVYAATAPTPRPADRRSRTKNGAGDRLIGFFSNWYWKRPDIDPQLMLGAVCSQMLGAAMPKRPVCWMTGGASTGKSSFQDVLLQIHGGDTGLLKSADATKSGVASLLKNSCLPVALDEAEPDEDNPKHMKDLITLARIAWSGDNILRGSADQRGHRSKAFSAFLFSSIYVPPMPVQDLQRLVLFELERLPPSASRLDVDNRKLRAWGAALRRRLIDCWDRVAKTCEAFETALLEAGHKARAANNYGTLLGLSHVMIADELPTNEELDNWVEKILIEGGDMVNHFDDAAACISHLLTSFYDPFRRGEQHTIAEWIMVAAKLPQRPMELEDYVGNRASKLLSKAGLKVSGQGDEAVLHISTYPFQGLKGLYMGSIWANGVWTQALARTEGVRHERRVLSFAGNRQRALDIPLAAISQHLSFEKDSADGVSSLGFSAQDF
ncbi:MAG: hypothetical protein AAFU34_15620 [Pseudomonadota bacterium]